MQGYTIKELEHLSLRGMGPARLPVLAYLLWETHLPTKSPLHGTPVDYSRLQVPIHSLASHKDQALLLHPTATVLWQRIG